MNEEWKVIEGYDFAYRVSSFGRVEGTRVLMKPYDNGYGYLIVELKQQGKKKHKRVHRLVAEAFIGNPTLLPEVNHKDENKHNNIVTNLEWCTSSYNKRYGNGRTSRSEGMKKEWKERMADDGKTD